MSDPIYPQGMAVDPVTGKTWFTSPVTECRVFAFGRAGVGRHVAGAGSCTPSGDGGHARAAGLEYPARIAVDSTHVYVAGWQTVRRIDRAHGGISTFVGDVRHRSCSSAPLAAVGRQATEVAVHVVGIAVDPVGGNLFISDGCQHAILEIDVSTGTIISKWFGIGTPIWAIGEIAISNAGEVHFVGEPWKRTIYKITGPSSAALVAGTGGSGFSGDGGPATRATFNEITALAFDAADNLYLASGSYAHIKKIDTSGTLSTVIDDVGSGTWGGVSPGIAGDTKLTTVTALAVDPDQNLYSVSDRIVASIAAPVSASSRWSHLVKNRLGVLEIERSGGRNPAINNCDQACHGDPVNTATGEYWEETSDLAIGGRGLGIGFVRSYGSSRAGVDGPLGYGWTHRYAMSLTVESDGYVSVRQENGSEIGFEPDGSGGYRAMTGQFASLTENLDGTFTLVRRQRETFHFAADGKLTGIQDLNGYVTTVGYDGSGRLETVTDEAGRTVTLSYDGSDRIVRLADPAGRTVGYAYDGSGDLVEVTDVRGQRWTYAYEDHLLLSRTDPNGHVDFENVYDADGAVLTQEDGEGGLTRFEYLPSLTRTTSPEGRVTEYHYVGGQLVQKVEAAGTREAATWRYEYDVTTRGVTRTTDPRGNVWTAAYNSAGLRTSTRTPLSHTTSTTYDAQGNVLTHRDELSVTTTMTYDGGGNLLTRSRPVSGQTVSWTYAYDDVRYPGDLTRLTDPLGKVTQYAYDAYGNQTSVTDPTGAQATSTYDVLGRPETTVSPRGNEAGNDPADYTTRYDYDAAGNLLSQVDPLGNEQRWTYDPAGNQASATDEAGKQTRYAYDDADRLVTTTRADLTTLQQGYDSDGLLLSRTDGAGVRTDYVGDAHGRLSSVTDPNRRTTTFSYDANGNLTTVVDPASETTTNTYDASNRLTRIAYSDGTTSGVTFSYDAAGRRTGITDTTGNSTFVYDALGMLTQHTDGAGRTTRYAYDRASQLTTLTYPNSRAVTRAYDDAGRLTSVTDWLGNATTFGYDGDGHLTRTTFPRSTGLEDIRAYDETGDLTDVTMQQGGVTQTRLAYDHDPRGLVSQVDQTGLPGAGTLGYGYTDLAELALENGSTYTHDRAGNLVEMAGARPLVYDNAGQLLEGPVTPGSPTTTAEFDYDQRGSRIEASPLGGPATTYDYDQAERLTSYTPAGGATTSYAYDGSGLRVSKTTSARTTRFTWDRSGGLPLLLGDDANHYIHGPGGLPIAHITSGGTVRYYHQDTLGSTRALSDESGAAVGTFTYTPHGTIAGSTGTETTPLGYAGQQTDHESGLQYLRARYYDPATGQFLTRDPLTEQTGQPYAYADGDPVNNIDPSGNFSWPNPGQLGTRFVGFVDGATFGATAEARDALGLNGGLDKCSRDYQAANTIGGLTTEAMGGAALGAAGIAARFYRVRVFEQQARGGRGLFVVRDQRIARSDKRVFALDRHPLRPRYEKPKTHVDMPQRDVRHWPYTTR